MSPNSEKKGTALLKKSFALCKAYFILYCFQILTWISKSIIDDQSHPVVLP